MPNYQNSKIYKITCAETDDVYIGSTTRQLNNRFSDHYSKYRKYIKDNKLPHCTSVNIVKYRSAEITLICDYPCNSGEELRIKEGEYIKNTPNCINKCIAGITPKEIDEYRYKEYNCDCGGKYKYHYKAKHMKSKQHIYYVENGQRLKDVFIPKKKQIINCPCGGTHNMKPAAIRMHEKSKQHIYYVKHGKVKPKTCSKNGGLKCECGSIVNDLVRHRKSKKHQKYLENL